MTSTPGMVLAGGAARESIYSSSISKIGRSLVSKSYYLYDGLNEEENFSFDLRAFLIERGYDKVGRVFGGEIINDYALLTSMLRFGGFQAVVFNRRMKSVVRHYKGQLADSLTSASSVIHQYYSSQLYAYEHALVHGRDAKMPEIPHLTRPRAGADPVRNRQGSVAPDIEPSVPQVSALPVPLPKPLRPLALKPLGNGVTSSLLKFAKSSPHVNASNGSTPHSKRLPIIVPCPPLLLPAPKEMAGSSTGCNLKKVGNSHNQDQLRSKLKVFAPSLVDVVRAANRDRVLWRPAVAGSGGDSDVRRQCRAIVYTSRRDVAIGHEVVASISGVALSELKPWLDGQFEGNTSVIEARVRNFLILYCGGLLNHLLPGNAGLLTHDELQEMYPWNVGVSGTPSAHIAVTTSIVAPDPPAVRTRGDRVGGSDRPVVARKTSLSTPPGVGECMPSPVAPGNRSGIHVRPHRSNSDIVKPRLAKSQSTCLLDCSDKLVLSEVYFLSLV